MIKNKSVHVILWTPNQQKWQKLFQLNNKHDITNKQANNLLNEMC